MHAYNSEYPAGPVRSHGAGENELKTQLTARSGFQTPLQEVAQVLAVLAVLFRCKLDIASPPFPFSRDHAGVAGLRGTGMIRASKA